MRFAARFSGGGLCYWCARNRVAKNDRSEQRRLPRPDIGSGKEFGSTGWLGTNFNHPEPRVSTLYAAPTG
jgi:hypothetical protein